MSETQKEKAAAMHEATDIGTKMTKAGREMLDLLAQGDRYDITDESVVNALGRRGLAERTDGQKGHWNITPAGRSLLRSLKAKEERNG